MSKKKNGGFLSRLIWSIVILGLAVVGIIIFLSTLSTVGVRATYSESVELPIIGTFTMTTIIAFKGFATVFGGKLDSMEVTFQTSGSDSDIKGEMPNVVDELTFNYVVFIGIVLVILGVILAVLIFRKKKMQLFAAALIILGAILLCINSFIFPLLNKDALQGLTEVDGISFLDIPGLLLGIFAALSGLSVLFHSLTLKK